MKKFYPEEDEQVIVTLLDETGDEVELELLDTVIYRGKEYAILIPLEEENSVVILAVDGSLDDGAECAFSEVDDALLEPIFAIYEKQAALRDSQTQE